MILSKKNSFIFMKGKKVAGTSIEVLLSAICGPEDIITPITPIDERYRLKCGYRGAQNYGARHEALERYISLVNNLPQEEMAKIVLPKGDYRNHMSFVEMADLFGEIPSEWFVFAVERCPYRKIMSMANMMIGFRQYRSTGNIMKSDVELLRTTVSEVVENGNIKRVKNIDLYKDRDGRVRPRVFRYESLQEGIREIMAILHVETYPELPHLKKGVSASNLELNDVFSREQFAVVNEVFHEEFECFGYEMIS